MITERLRQDMKVLFIGFNPSLTSYERGFNYAGRNNRFYRVLFESGLTRRLYSPEESPQLLEDYDYGFTNIVTRPTRRSDELSLAEYREGTPILQAKLQKYHPQVACFVGKGVYQQFTRRQSPIPWGFQEASTVRTVLDFVGPATSGLVRMTLVEQVTIYRTLAQRLQQ